MEVFLTESLEQNLIYKYSNENNIVSFEYENISIEQTKLFVEKIINFLKTKDSKPLCGNCKQSNELIFANFNGNLIEVCEPCFAKIEESINIPKKQQSLIKGIIGAFIGASLGGVIWVIIGSFGFIASIAGLAIAYFASAGFSIMKGKMVRATPVIIALITLIVVFVANFATVFLSVSNELGNDITFSEKINLLVDTIINNNDVLFTYLKDLGIGILFAGFGAYRVIRSMHKKRLI